MNFKLTGSGVLVTAAVIGAVVFVYVAKQKAEAAVQAVNPANNNNIISNGFNEPLSTATGRETSLGSELFDLVGRITGRAPYDPNAVITNYDTSGPIKGAE